jgi:hypothetical protein
VDSRKTFYFQSVGIHLLLLTVFACALWLMPKRKASIARYKVEIQEVKTATPIERVEPEINLTKPPPEPISAKPRQKVFGITKDTLTSTQESAVGVKLGTTLAKENDDIVIEEKDAIGLPVPTAEYLVSEMPRLKAEVRIPYPH